MHKWIYFSSKDQYAILSYVIINLNINYVKSMEATFPTTSTVEMWHCWQTLTGKKLSTVKIGSLRLLSLTQCLRRKLNIVRHGCL